MRPEQIVTIALFATLRSEGMFSPSPGEYKLNSTIATRVLLQTHQHSVGITSPDGKFYWNGEMGGRWKKLGISARLELKRIAEDPKLYLNDRALPHQHIYFRGENPSSILRLNHRLYRGILHVFNSRNALSIVNILGLEEYLLGTLPFEMAADWPIEALKAQSVASRSYATYMHLHPKSTNYDLKADITDQIYSGSSRESKKIVDAVLLTKDEHLGVGGVIQKAYFHSRCGGHTDRAEIVWNNKSAGGKVTCPYCLVKPYYWETAFNLDEFKILLGFPPNLGRIKLAIAQQSSSGRTLSMSISSKMGDKNIGSDQLRRTLGYSRLKSAIFNWSLTDNSIAFKGVGSGHGVGMCQWGARHLALLGKNYRQILKHYYPGYQILSGVHKDTNID